MALNSSKDFLQTTAMQSRSGAVWRRNNADRIGEHSGWSAAAEAARNANQEAEHGCASGVWLWLNDKR